MARIQRLTTTYDEREDRFRITGESEAGEVHALLLTRRLLQRLVVHLLKILDPEPAGGPSTLRREKWQSGLMQEMAQLQAGALLKLETPVVANAEQPAWLAESVDINRQEGRIVLAFKDQDDTRAETALNTRELRQWLIILHRLWRNAEWSEEVWPDWMKAEAPAAAGLTEALH